MKTRLRRILIGTAVLSAACLAGLAAADNGHESPNDPLSDAALQSHVQAQTGSMKSQYLVTIAKKPKAVVEDGPLLVRKYNMSGRSDYALVMVRDDAAKALVAALLRQLKVGDVSVRTLADAASDNKDRDNPSTVVDDLRTHAAVVELYENEPDPHE